MALFAIEEDSQWIKAVTTSSLDLCSDLMGSVVGQASFPFHISQKNAAIYSGYWCWINKIKMRQLWFQILKIAKVKRSNFSLITGDEACKLSISGSSSGLTKYVYRLIFNDK